MNAQLTYKAVVYTNNKSLKVVNRTIDISKHNGNITVKTNQILIKVKATDINPIDILLFATKGSMLNFSNKEFGIGLDYSGRVIAVGDAFAAKYNVAVDDNVCGMVREEAKEKCLAEYLLLELHDELFTIIKVPSTLSMIEAGSFATVFSAAVTIVHQLTIKPHDKILVFGTGSSVGRYLLPLLHHNGNTQQIIGVCSPRSKQKSLELGANEVVNYKSTTFLKDILAYTKDRPFDIFLDLTGSEILLKNIDKVLKKHGTYVNLGGGKKHNLATDSFRAVITWDLIKMHIANGLRLNHYQFFQIEIDTDQTMLQQQSKYFESGLVTPVIDRVFKFQEFQHAWDYMKQGTFLGKVVIEFD